MPLDAEEIHAKFSPDEEYSNNNQSEDQLPKEVPGITKASVVFYYIITNLTMGL